MCIVQPLIQKKNKELTLENIRTLIRRVAFFKPMISLSGGEPLLREDIGEILILLKQAGLICGMTTNGLLLGKKAGEILGKGLSSLTVSLDGGESAHDALRGKGAYGKITEGLSRMDFLRRRKKDRDLNLRVSCMINALNYTSLDKVIEICRRLNVDELQFRHLDYKTPRTVKANEQIFQNYFGVKGEVQGFISGRNSAFPLEKMSYPTLFETIGRIKTERQPLKVSFAPDLSMEDLPVYYSKKPFHPSFRCLSRWHDAWILHDGTLAPCLGYRIGNLLEHDFQDLWNSTSFKHFRSVLKKEAYFPGCRRCCSGWETFIKLRNGIEEKKWQD